MQQLIAKREEIEGLLEIELKNCRNAGFQYAENEANYRKALRIAILKERMGGTPVTIISDLCRGQDDIAELRRLRDCSEALYKSSQEAINIYKLRLRTLEADINRMWTSGGTNDN